ncbi:MAG: TonB-dependent receptor plug domain-containing protein, partial [Hyphomonadaceae bacterium]
MLSLKLRDQPPSRGQRLLLTASCLVLGSALSPPALAQDTNRDSWAKDSVVVAGEKDSFTAPNTATATRTDTPIEKVPQSIQILTRTLIEEQDLQTVSDALTNISGVVPSKTSEIVLQSPAIRGFATDYLVDGLPAYGLPTGIVDPGSLVNVER